MSEMFEIIPAVDMKGGKCVQLVQGVPGSEMVSLEDPVKAAMSWVEQGARTLHLVDLDGAIDGVRNHAPVIRKIVQKAKKEGVTVEVGGGIRSFEDAAGLLELGVDRVILSTIAMKQPEIIDRLSGRFGKEAVVVGLDSKSGRVAVEGWTKISEYRAVDVAGDFEKRGAGYILFTNIDSEGLLRGVDPEPTAELVRAVGIPVIASGGVASLNDLKRLKEAGACGVVVGSALYTGKFTLPEATDFIRRLY